MDSFTAPRYPTSGASLSSRATGPTFADFTSHLANLSGPYGGHHPSQSSALGRMARRAGLGIVSRARSLAADGAWVRETCESHYPIFPVIANLRTGSWHVGADPPPAATRPPGAGDAQSDGPAARHDSASVVAASAVSANGGPDGPPTTPSTSPPLSSAGPTTPRREAYFKSTDGHVGAWAFSHTRLNLGVVISAAERGGAVIVDATRHGKRFPDSLSRTVPLWAAVINELVLAGDEGRAERSATDEDTGSRSGEGDAGSASTGAGAGAGAGAGRAPPLPPLSALLPPFIPPSEVALLTSRLPELVNAVPMAVREAVRTTLGGPMRGRPLVTHFVCQPPSSPRRRTKASAGKGAGAGAGSTRPGGRTEDWMLTVPPLIDPCEGDGSLHLVLMSASRFVEEEGDLKSAHEGWTYMPGAGDDADSWAKPLGMTPAFFWRHAAVLAGAYTDAECEALIAQLKVMEDGGGAGLQDHGAPARALRNAGEEDPRSEASAATDAGADSSLVALDVLGTCSSARRLHGSCVALGPAVPPSTSLLEPPSSSLSPPNVVIVVSPWLPDHATAPADPAAGDEDPESSSSQAPSSSSAVASRGRLESSPCLRLRLPADKPARSKFKELWRLQALPAVEAAVADAFRAHQESCWTAEIEASPGDDPGGGDGADVPPASFSQPSNGTTSFSVLVTYSATSGLAGASAVAAAAAHLALLRTRAPGTESEGDGSGTLTKADLRAAVSLAQLASGAASTDRALLKELNNFFLGSPRFGAAEGRRRGAAGGRRGEGEGEEEGEDEEED
jgi:hypothetical protein